MSPSIRGPQTTAEPFNATVDSKAISAMVAEGDSAEAQWIAWDGLVTWSLSRSRSTADFGQNPRKE